MSRRARTPDGRRWIVARRWTRHRIRWRGWRKGKGESDARWWDVEARTAGPPAESRTWRVTGWKASGRAISEVALRLDAGLVDVGPADTRR